MSGAMRDKMPLCAAFIDDLREAFGRDEIDNAIRLGLHPDCPPEKRFFASENGHVLGKPAPEPVRAVSGADMVIGPLPVIETKRGRR